MFIHPETRKEVFDEYEGYRKLGHSHDEALKYAYSYVRERNKMQTEKILNQLKYDVYLDMKDTLLYMTPHNIFKPFKVKEEDFGHDFIDPESF